MYYEMTVYGFTLDPLAQRPVVILKDANENNPLPIWISSTEAVSMAVELISRDLGHSGKEDLLSALMEHAGMKLDRIALDSLNDGFVTASVLFKRNGGEELKIDVRPYVALAAALKFKMPVMVAEEVVTHASLLARGEEKIEQENNARRFVDFLENLDPAELGKYPM